MINLLEAIDYMSIALTAKDEKAKEDFPVNQLTMKVLRGIFPA